MEFLKNIPVEYWALIASTVAFLISGISAFFSWRQNKLHDIVELYANYGERTYEKVFIQNKDGKKNTEKILVREPYIRIQNVGSRIVYFDQYNFNGKIYDLNGQVRPPTSSNAIDNYYYIDLPTNGENHVSVLIEYRDIDNRSWKTQIFATVKDNNWHIETYPRKKNAEPSKITTSI